MATRSTRPTGWYGRCAAAAAGAADAGVVPTCRILTPNPAGILFQKWRQGKVIVEPESDTVARYEELTAEAAAAGKPGPPKPSFFK